MRLSGYVLPQSTCDDFAKARPQHVRDGFTREVSSIEETIGPWQMAGGALWFGKTFYDAEGTTGVGGFIATDFGAAVLEGGKLKRFFVDRTSAGRLQVAEAKLGTGAK